MPTIIGLITIIIASFFLVISIIQFRSQKLKFSKSGLSELGGIKQTATLFNFNLMLLAIFQTIFMVYYSFLFGFISSGSGIVALILLTTTGLGAGLCAIFNTKQSNKVHKYLGAIVFIVAGPAWILSGLTILSQNSALGFVLILSGVFVSASFALGFMKSKNMPALYESVFFMAIILTDLATTLLFK